MLTRRLVRIKTLQALYAWQQTDSGNLQKGKSALQNTLLEPYDVYLFLLEFPLAFQQFLESEREAEKSKYYPDKDYIRTCQLLSKNDISVHLNHRSQSRNRRQFSIKWTELATTFESIWKPLQQEEFVKDHLVFDSPDFVQQQEFTEQLYQYLILACEPFHSMMEECYAGWNDDEELLLKELTRTVLAVKADGTVRLSEQDAIVSDEVQFGLKLFELVASNGAAYEQRIADITDNWDPARIAILDLVAIKMALAEFTAFPQIPLKVTINEYLDIIKDYSTPNSSRFLNGVLDKMRKKLEENGEIRKAGRGLRDN